MKLLLIICMLLPAIIRAQVEWASGVEFTSSEAIDAENSKAFKGAQALGYPSVCPGSNVSSVCAWSPANQNSDYERITVKFKGKTTPTQLVIFENFNPGAIIRVEAYDAGNKLIFKLQETKGFKHAADSMPLSIPIQVSVPVAKVMLTLNPSLVPGYNQIDAVGLSASSNPVRLRINQVAYGNFNATREALSPAINSSAHELSPVISPDGKTLFFTRQDHPKNISFENGNQDIWMAPMLAGGKQGEPVQLPAPLNNGEHNSLASIMPDGQRALLLNEYYKGGPMTKGLSMSKRNGDVWEFPQNLKIDKYYNDNNFGEYYLLPNSRCILMAIERRDGFGSKDLHVSFQKEDGTWTEPKNLGSTLNTAGAETSPFLAADERTLYFASPGHMGFGGADVFMSRRLGDGWTEWSEPQNLGPVINSNGFDAYYTIPASGDYAYFTSHTPKGKSDIYRIKLPEAARPKPVALIRGRVFDAETKKPLASTIIYETLDPATERGRALSNSKDGFYSITLPGGELYGFQAEAKGYYPVSENLDLKKLNKYEEYTVDLYLHPVKVGQKIKLNNVFFDLNKYSFQKSTYPELDRLAGFMQSLPQMKIVIEGHTDDQGADDYNLTLSTNRAKAVYDYLVAKGIKADRMRYVGYGETKPLTKELTPEGRARNRRVEFVIEAL